MWIWFFLLFGSGLGHSAKSNSKNEERKVKERLPTKGTRPKKTASKDVNFGKSKSCQAQDTLQFSLPLLPKAKNKQHAAKYRDLFWSLSSSANEGTWKCHVSDLLNSQDFGYRLWLYQQGSRYLQKSKFFLVFLFWKIVCIHWLMYTWCFLTTWISIPNSKPV